MLLGYVFIFFIYFIFLYFFPKAPPEMGSRLDFGVQGLARDLLWLREAFPGKL